MEQILTGEILPPGRRQPGWPAPTMRSRVLGLGDSLVLIGVGVACGTSWAVALTWLAWWAR
jgi:hypothetical protein